MVCMCLFNRLYANPLRFSFVFDIRDYANYFSDSPSEEPFHTKYLPTVCQNLYHPLFLLVNTLPMQPETKSVAIISQT